MNSLGPLGTVPNILNLSSSYHSITHNEILLNKYLLHDNSRETFLVPKSYLIDENRRIYNLDPCSNIILTPYNLNWYFLHHDYWEDTSTIINLGQFICENICISKDGPHVKSGQIIYSLVIRLTKYHLSTRGATVHGHYGEILYEGDTLVIFIYEKSRSGDIIQGLPKVEQVLEVRSIDSISMNLERRLTDGTNT
ncbi:hypothetical protein AMTRI_Chr02g260670 [Amborella trichopoda]